MEHFRLFVLPFWLGAFFLLVTLLYKYIGWFVGLTAAERRLFVRSLFTRSTFRSVGEVISESLLHRKIWRTNKLLGYMHTSFALGWFLLILTGWIETLVYFKGENVPLYVDIFFSYYVHPIFEHNFNFSLIKDALLLLILIGIGLALFKRIRSRMMGMRRTTRHTPGDRIALSALWLIFPARLLAESMTSGVIWKFGGIVWALGEEHHLIPPGVGCGSFLTNSTGELLARILPPDVLMAGELPTWWFYSITLGVFFRRAAVLALYAYFYRDSADFPTKRGGCAAKKNRRATTISRPTPARAAASASTPASCNGPPGSTACSRSTSCATCGAAT